MKHGLTLEGVCCHAGEERAEPGARARERRRHLLKLETGSAPALLSQGGRPWGVLLVLERTRWLAEMTFQPASPSAGTSSVSGMGRLTCRRNRGKGGIDPKLGSPLSWSLSHRGPGRGELWVRSLPGDREKHRKWLKALGQTGGLRCPRTDPGGVGWGQGSPPQRPRCTPSWLFLPTMFPTNPSPPHHSRPPAHWPTNSRQLLQFLALVHPLHPGGLITSDPRRWVNPLACLPPVHLPLPSHLEGKDTGASRRWGSSEQSRCICAPCRSGAVLSEGYGLRWSDRWGEGCGEHKPFERTNERMAGSSAVRGAFVPSTGVWVEARAAASTILPPFTTVLLP